MDDNDVISRKALKEAMRADIMGGLNWERIIDEAPAIKYQSEAITEALREIRTER